MKTLEERVADIEKQLAFNKHTDRYTWTITLSDSFGPSFTYKIYDGSGMCSIHDVAKTVAEKLRGDLSEPKCNY